MKEATIELKLSIGEARRFYFSENYDLRRIALKAFSEKEIVGCKIGDVITKNGLKGYVISTKDYEPAVLLSTEGKISDYYNMRDLPCPSGWKIPSTRELEAYAKNIVNVAEEHGLYEQILTSDHIEGIYAMHMNLTSGTINQNFKNSKYEVRYIYVF